MQKFPHLHPHIPQRGRVSPPLQGFLKQRRTANLQKHWWRTTDASQLLSVMPLPPEIVSHNPLPRWTFPDPSQNDQQGAVLAQQYTEWFTVNSQQRHRCRQLIHYASQRWRSLVWWSCDSHVTVSGRDLFKLVVWHVDTRGGSGSFPF